MDKGVNKLAAIAALVACILAGAALAVSLTHTGPRGRAGFTGPQGPPGKEASAAKARYGVCWTSASFTQTFSDGTTATWISSVDVSSPQLVAGVYQCPSGEQFVSIVPIPQSAIPGQ